MPTVVKLAKNILIASFAVFLSVIVCSAIGVGRWMDYAFRQWPDLLSRYEVIFALLLTAALVVAVDLQKRAANLLFSLAAGIIAGAAASAAALVLAQLSLEAYRERFLNGFGMGIYSIAASQLAFIVLGTLGWLYGILAAASVHCLNKLPKIPWPSSSEGNAGPKPGSCVADR